MKKFLCIMLILAFLTIAIAPSLMAIEIPRECGWAQYSPGYLIACLMLIAFEYGMSYFDLLNQLG